jgi:hypothetical protein
MRVEKEKDCFCFTNLISGNEKLKKIMGFKLAVFIYYYYYYYYYYMNFDYLGFLIL